MTDNNKGRYSVLFVDDEEKALKYFGRAISDRFPVLTASDVDSAIDLLQEKSDHIAIVISDQRMPGKNGVELLKFVRQHYPGIVRLLTTAYSDLNDAIDAINRGEIYRYIQKPWHVESLQAEVAGAMHYFLLRRERDLLLAEKLSTRQRMMDVQRLGQLMVYAQTLTGLPNPDYGLRDFLQLLHAVPGARESDNLSSVDQWELTRWESKRSSDFLSALQLRFSPLHSSDEKSLNQEQVEATLHELAGSFQLELSIQRESAKSISWQGQAAFLNTLLEETFALLALLRSGQQLPDCHLATVAAPHSGGDAVSLTFTLSSVEWPTDRHLLSGSVMTDVNPIFQHLFVATFIASALGGRCQLNLEEQMLTLQLILPKTIEPLPELGWEWQSEVLSDFEPAIEEFYPEL